ncbi:MAG: hypothetical protein AB1591_09395 [Pseudomonadota bacterium]
MIALVEKIKSLVKVADSRRASPFASPKTSQRWLQKLPDSSDYDAHHALVEGLERYNGDMRGDAYKRVKALEVIEEAGLPLQDRLVAQYLEGHGGSDAFRQTLWRECHLFWDQLAVAYVHFLNLALKHEKDSGKLASIYTRIVAKSMRYSSLTMRWEYLRGRRPSESAWRRLHKIYRAAENAEVAFSEVTLGAGTSTCAREYVMTLLYDLANPYAFAPAEIELALQTLDSLKKLPVPESGLRHGRHSHMVDLSGSTGPERIDERWVPGGRLRYLDMRGVIGELEALAGGEGDILRSAVYKKLSRVIGREGTSRGGLRKPRFGDVRAVFGIDAILKTYAPPHGVVPNTKFITLRDESSKGMGFALDDEPDLEPGSLLAVDREEGEGAWQLLAVRWAANEDGQWQLGTEVLSKYPKRVEIEWQIDSGKQSAVALFLPLASASQGGTSNLLVPPAAYECGRELVLKQDDGTIYRLRLGGIAETHESWPRVGFDVLSRVAA